uniref:Reverse transcriptase domain-containing protein n=1 Tax=Trichuris muris TaxID=70415 RepID=A0A5S6QIW3_TRIMR
MEQPSARKTTFAPPTELLIGKTLKIFKRYVDDVFAIVENGKVIELLNHLNESFPNKIAFTVEEGIDGQLPFLDVLVASSSIFSLTIP